MYCNFYIEKELPKTPFNTQNIFSGSGSGLNDFPQPLSYEELPLQNKFNLPQIQHKQPALLFSSEAFEENKTCLGSISIGVIHTVRKTSQTVLINIQLKKFDDELMICGDEMIRFFGDKLFEADNLSIEIKNNRIFVYLLNKTECFCMNNLVWKTDFEMSSVMYIL